MTCVDLLKLDAIGDCFMAAAGLNNAQQGTQGSPSVSQLGGGVAKLPPGIHGAGALSALNASNHAASIVTFAHAIIAEARNHRLPTTGEALDVRVGIHTGPLISGLVGSVRRKYTVIGEQH